MKDTFYFPHDYNSRTDEKIKLLIRKHGIEGYGIFWAIVEDLYNNTNVLRLDYDGIAYDLRTNYDTIKSVINDFDLFIITGDFFGSKSIERRLNERNEKSEKARKSISNRWKKYERNTNVIRSEYECNTIKERKGKEIKGNSIEINIEREEAQKKVENNISQLPPSQNEVIEFYNSNGYADSGAGKFWNYYNLANWKDKDGGNMIPFWKQKAYGTWFKDAEKIKTFGVNKNILR